MSELISADDLFCGIEGVVSIALLRQRVETYGGMQLTKCESIALFDRIADLERETAALESQVKDAVEDAAKYARLARAASDRATQPPLNSDVASLQSALRDLSQAMNNPALAWEEASTIEVALINEATHRLSQPPKPSRSDCEHDFMSTVACRHCFGWPRHDGTVDMPPQPIPPSAAPFHYDSAARAAIKFLLSVYEQGECTSDGVSDCVRCSTVVVCRWFRELLDDRSTAPAEQPRYSCVVNPACPGEHVSKWDLCPPPAEQAQQLNPEGCICRYQHKSDPMCQYEAGSTKESGL